MLLEQQTKQLLDTHDMIYIKQPKVSIDSWFQKDIWFSDVKTDKIQKSSLEDTRWTNKLRKINSLYIVENKFDVHRFLQKHSNLIGVLLEAHPQIRKYFPTEKLRLKLYFDPESPEWEYLIIAICTSPEFVDEALNKQTEFDENWWIDASLGVAVNLSIDLEFE
ncbi:hypothetical protein H6F47_13515 [Sphaerospermopsis sp. FACHB-1094]|uniref:hypothetical protein n=1 Tax=Sphaerospermopsis sp. FACHB-1094 TaxID=2692861 RepID=UPI001685D43B|nr:hypothetical protein [Sphaerospermopsis sp. FACHB-1094]MBD2133419.1 hypothetical protein [Sphaerospermopsis sp. FACHB-1094]